MHSIKQIIIIIGIYFILYPLLIRTTDKISAKKVIIIGATSGIGYELAKECAKRGYIIGATGRRTHLLQALQQEIATPIVIQTMDIAKSDEAQTQLKALIQEMGGANIIVINAAVGNCSLEWEKQKEMIDINVLGFTAMASVATEYFIQKGDGHIVGISSIIALRGSSAAPTYSASKAYVSQYLHGLRGRFMKLKKPIYVTIIEPGLIYTAMRGSCDTNTQPSDFWRATAQEAAIQIADAIDAQREHAYVTKRWRLIAWVIKLIPDYLFYKFF